MTFTILILDDEDRRRADFKKRIRDAGLSEQDYTIELLESDSLKQVFEVMLKRQDHFRQHGYWLSEPKMRLDDVDFLIVDNELREFFRDTGIFTSADEVAYMARCFSHCGLILVVNRISQNPFDLTLNLSYQGQFDAFSDMEIGQKQLSSKVLWGTGNDEFHPWNWAILPNWLGDFKQRIADVRDVLKQNESVSILEYFGLDDVKEWIPRIILQRLGAGHNYTFLEFLQSSSFAMSPKDQDALKTITGQMVDSVAPIIAARLSKWLKIQLLPEMDLLIDAPHLISRFPSLLTGDHKSLEVWNSVAVRHSDTVPNLKAELLDENRFPRSHWLSRPVWYWRKVMDNERIPDVKNPWDIEYVPYVFCEDISLFVQEGEAQTFQAAVESPFGNRYVKKIPGVDYLPPQRLAL